MFSDNELLQLIWLGIVLLGWYSAWDSQLRWLEGNQSDVKLVALLNPVGLVTYGFQKLFKWFGSRNDVIQNGSICSAIILAITCIPCGWCGAAC